MSTEDGGEELRDLRDLVQSPGWARYRALVDQLYGPEAVLRDLEKKLSGVPLGDQDGVQDMTQHVLSAAKAARTVLLLPQERIAALVGQRQPRKPFQAWRRA